MDVLSGRARGGHATGDVRFNNFPTDQILIGTEESLMSNKMIYFMKRLPSVKPW